MMNDVPESMEVLGLPAYGPPSTYQLLPLPTPSITKPDEVLIKVHATSINPIDVKFAAGQAKRIRTDTFPYRMGYDVSGTIVAIGSAVTTLKVGDEVYSRVPNHYRGTVAEYTLSTEAATALKPATLSFDDAASIPLAALTALQCMQYADAHLEGGLKGKTVLVPAGLGGTGSFAVQLALNVFNAGKVITTVSTKKIPKAQEFFGNGALELVDYTKQDVLKTIGEGTVDYFFDTMGSTIAYLPVMKRGGVIVSISTLPSGSQMRTHAPEIPFIAETGLTFADRYYKWRCSRYGVHYTYIFVEPSAEDLNQLSNYVKEAKVKPLVGSVAKFRDIEAVRSGCQEIYDGKGGLGKFVITME